MKQTRLGRQLRVVGLAAIGLAVGGQANAPAAGPAKGGVLSQQTEAAYRANNLGVALLEQYRFSDGAEALKRAVGLDGSLAVPRINLAIALLYVPDLPGAETAAREASERAPDALQPLYVRGLVARAENRAEEAIAWFEKVLAIDPKDVGALLNRGQILMQMRRYDQAIASFNEILALEPFNATATYNLGVALNRSGKRDEGMAVMTRFQRLRESPSRTELGQSYREQGRYAEAVVSTGAEAGLVNLSTPDVRFEDVTAAVLGGAGRTPQGGRRIPETAPRRGAGALSISDLDGDGDLDWAEATPSGMRLRLAESGKLVEATRGSGLEAEKAASLLAGDMDGDGKPDLLLLREGSVRLLLNRGAGRFEPARGPMAPGPRTLGAAALVDADHDGDLDVLLGVAGKEAGGALRLLRNSGDGTLSDVTAEARLESVAGSVVAVVPTDFDNRRDVDFLVLFRDRAPALLKNMRDGTFQDVAAGVGLPRAGRYLAVAAADVNKDDFTDFAFVGDAGPVELALSDGRGGFKVVPGPPASTGASGVLWMDYDLDGLLDLLVDTPGKLMLFRSLGGDRWSDVTEDALGRLGAPIAANGLLAADQDADGAPDLVLGEPGTLRLLRNVGGSRNHSAVVRLAGLASNRSGVGAKVEVRAGSLRQRIETYVTWPAVAPVDLVFGLGGREAADAIRILWPSGILQTETETGSATAGALVVAVRELDRKPSSCPYLYAWNGSRFEFVTDFLGAGEMGYFVAPGARSVPDPEEYVRIRSDQLRPNDGRLELRVTNELEECVFLDHTELFAVMHPEGVEVFPNEGMTSPPKLHRLFAVRAARPAVRAVEDSGRDVTDRIARLDGRYADGFRVRAIRGYAEEHTLTIDLGPRPIGGGALLLTGWTDYAFSSDNVAASQAGVTLQPPVLQARDETGRWTTIVEQVGVPVGRPQTIVVDLSGRWLGGSSEVRIVTNMRIYWDEIRVGAIEDLHDLRPARLPARAAILRERGFSAEITSRPPEPRVFDYVKVSPVSQWKAMTGRYTRVGDVLQLLERSDDLFVVSKPGDEVALSFDASGLDSLPTGWQRTYLLKGDGFSKEMDINSSSPDAVLPLPYHGMRQYPYLSADAPARIRAIAARAEGYNSRLVTRPILPVEASGSESLVAWDGRRLGLAAGATR
jgi:tetratricopeptide (TPR) repeat protein